MHPHCPVKRACFQRLRKRPLRLCRHLEVPAAIDQHHRALNCSSRRSSVTIDPALTLSSLHPCTIQMEICTGRSVPGYRFFYRYLFCMFSRHILKTFISGFRFMCAFRILGRVLGMAPSTLCRWNLLRHGDQEDSLRSAWKAQRSHPSKRASSGRIKRALSCGSFSTCSPGWILLLVLVSSRKISLSTSPLPNATACTCVCRRQRTRLRDRPAVTDELTDRHQLQKHTQESSISFCARRGYRPSDEESAHAPQSGIRRWSHGPMGIPDRSRFSMHGLAH